MKWRVSISLLALLNLGGISQNALAGAQEGRELAQEWCQTCHVTEEEKPGVDVAPPWASIANDPTKTDGILRAWLAMPQGQMAHIALTRQQINDVMAYIHTLKKK